jgi:hypothetical protein
MGILQPAKRISVVSRAGLFPSYFERFEVSDLHFDNGFFLVFVEFGFQHGSSAASQFIDVAVKVALMLAFIKSDVKDAGH